MYQQRKLLTLLEYYAFFLYSNILFLLYRVVQFGDYIIFDVNVSRTDETVPVYEITLTAAIYHPLEEVLTAMFHPTLVDTTDNDVNEIRTTLTLPRLSYDTDQSTLFFTFNGSIGDLAYTVPSIQLRGEIVYETSPTNGHQYHEMFYFPEVFIRHANFSLELMSTSSDSTRGPVLIQDEEALFRGRMTEVFNFGESANLSLLVEVDGMYLSIVSTDVVQVGYVLIWHAVLLSALGHRKGRGEGN